MGSPRVKDSNQKVFRWTFEAVAENAGQVPEIVKLPGNSFGHRRDGRESAQMLEHELNKDSEKKIRVRAIPHELVSFETIMELQRLSYQLGVYKNVSQKMAGRLSLLQNNSVSQQSAEDVLKYFLKLEAESIPKVEAVPVPTYQETVVEDAPKRKLGIEALQEILQSPSPVEDK